ncbi:MAG: M64 family metallopeptidase, partial [Acidobacteria bacterium]|nr:M64 family metallopeptidase [Acidobacteriota bacterium]
MRPVGVQDLRGERYGTYSERTIAVAFAVDRDQASLISFTLKDRPFVRSLATDHSRPTGEGNGIQLEFVLLGASGLRYTQFLDFSGICLEHGPDEPPHILEDTIRVHRDTIVVEFPEVNGLDRIEVADSEKKAGNPSRKLLGSVLMDSAHFLRAGGNATYGDLAFAAEKGMASPPEPETSGNVIWPENVGDPDIYTVFGNAAESDRRINVTIVPDGYTYAQKSLMVSHATQMVQYFRSTTPYREHDNLINYVLVYAYSVESGTDQCDCSFVANTAMSTGFPDAGYPCGDQGNRCLYYGYSCDTNTSFHIATAELRAPASDAKVVMVNTARYGGCGGQRAVYSAANASATDVAAHELGHSLANLADEYVSNSGCGSEAGNINTSTNASTGAWPEWIADLGPPWQGAQYWSQCIYRPAADCTMRSLGSQ